MGSDEAKVATRLARQEIFTGDDPPPPALVALIDERALRTVVGDESVMREQLERLAEEAQRHVIQVIPSSTRTYLHLSGAFTMATIDGRDLAFVDTPARGFVIDSPPVVFDLRRQWDVIRAQALPAPQSVNLIQEVAGQWT